MLPKAIQQSSADQTRWFTEKVQPHENSLRSWLRVRFPTITDLDDIIQEAYMRLVRANEDGRIKNGSVKPYLFSTARNLAIDLCRHEAVISVKRMTESDDIFVLDISPDAAENVCHGDELALLAEAIQALPDRCREILVLRKLHGLSQKEIAQKMGISENTVAAQASMGVRRCMEYFRNRNAKK